MTIDVTEPAPVTTGAWNHRAWGGPDDPVHASDLATFARCPRRFRFEKEQEAGRRRDKRVFGLAVSGTAVHEVLRVWMPKALAGDPQALNPSVIKLAYWEEVQKECTAEGIKWTELHWSDSVNPTSHHRNAVACLCYFLAAAPLKIGELLIVESKFRAVIRRKDQEIHTAGTVDLVFKARGTGRLVLADYKSGQRKLSTHEMSNGWQLGLYAHAVQHGVFDGGVTFGRYPEEIYIVHVRDFLPAQKDSSRKIWSRDECRHFGVGPGQSVKIKKGLPKGPGWYEAVRDPNEAPGFAECVGQVVGSVRMGRFTPVFNDVCQSCAWKTPCTAEGFGAAALTPAKRKKLDLALEAAADQAAAAGIGAIDEGDL